MASVGTCELRHVRLVRGLRRPALLRAALHAAVEVDAVDLQPVDRERPMRKAAEGQGKAVTTQ